MIDTSTRNASCCSDAAAGTAQHKTSFRPRFDVWETKDELVLLGDLPGVKPEDLDIRYENQELSIHGKVAAQSW